MNKEYFETYERVGQYHSVEQTKATISFLNIRMPYAIQTRNTWPKRRIVFRVNMMKIYKNNVISRRQMTWEIHEIICQPLRV